jgi:hypothetical protein
LYIRPAQRTLLDRDSLEPLDIPVFFTSFVPILYCQGLARLLATSSPNPLLWFGDSFDRRLAAKL